MGQGGDAAWGKAHDDGECMLRVNSMMMVCHDDGECMPSRM